MFNIEYDDVEQVKKTRVQILLFLETGIAPTEWQSEGSIFKGLPPASYEKILYATERFLDEYNQQLITDTVPNHYTWN